MGLRTGLRMEERNQIVRDLMKGMSWREAAVRCTKVEPEVVEAWKADLLAEAKKRAAEQPQVEEEIPFTEKELDAEVTKAVAAVKKEEESKIAALQKEIAGLKEQLDFLGGKKK